MLWCALGALIASAAVAGPGAAPPPQASASLARPPLAPGRSFDLDVAQLLPILDQLPQDERAEQVADWTIFGTVASSGHSQAEVRQALYDQVPRRDPALEEVARFEYGSGRRVILGKGVVWFFYLETDPHPEVTLGRLADQVRMELGTIPATAGIFRYRPELRTGAIHVSFVQVIPGRDLFTECYGYVEREVHTLPELRSWLAAVDDVTYARRVGDGVELGGRRFPGARTAPATLDDVAALYQAQRVLAQRSGRAHREPGFSLDPMWNGSALAEDLRDLARPEPDLASDGSSQTTDLLKAPINLLDKSNPSPASQLSGLWSSTRQWPERKTATVDARRLVERAYRLDAAVKARRAAGDESQTNMEVQAEAVVEAFPREDGSQLTVSGPERELLERVAGGLEIARTGSEQGAALAPLARLTQEEPTDGPSYRFQVLVEFALAGQALQCARYDGPLEGTQVGMTLFYTDLIAKVWAGVDYHHSAPVEQVRGFVTLPRMSPLPAIYWAEQRRLPNSRLWFGPRKDGYAFLPAEGEVAFSHVTTRVYAAGSNAASPGAEERPNESTRRTFSWWDRHFERIADYEPQYHRQNQIMKWSILTGWLAEGNRPALSCLVEVRVDHTQRFDRWFATRPELRYRSDVRLLPPASWPGKTECMESLASSSFVQTGGVHYIAGGVSLGGEAALLEGTQIRPGAVPEPLQRGGISYSASDPESITTLRGTTFGLPKADPAVVRIQPSETAHLRSGGTELNPRTLSTRFDVHAGGSSEVTVRVGETPMETLRVGVAEEGPRMELEAGGARDLEEVTASVAIVRNPRVTRTIEQGGGNPWARLEPRPGEYLVRSQGKLGMVIDGARTRPGAAKESFVVGAEGAPRGDAVLASTGEIGPSPHEQLAALTSDNGKVSAVRVEQPGAVRQLREFRYQELRPTESGQLVRTFTDEVPQGTAVTLSGPGLQGVKARATADALYLERGAEAPEAFEDLVTRGGLGAEDVRKAIERARSSAPPPQVELLSGRPNKSARQLVDAAGLHDPAVLELVDRSGGRGHEPEARAVQDFTRGRSVLPPGLRERLHLVREKYTLQTTLETGGLRWREVPRSERAELIRTGQGYAEEGGPLGSMEPDLAPGTTMAHVEQDEAVSYEELERPVEEELAKPSARVAPTELVEDGRTYVRWTPPPASRSSAGSPSRVYRVRFAQRTAAGLGGGLVAGAARRDPCAP